jgi:hypothetical protein
VRRLLRWLDSEARGDTSSVSHLEHRHPGPEVDGLAAY